MLKIFEVVNGLQRRKVVPNVMSPPEKGAEGANLD